MTVDSARPGGAGRPRQPRVRIVVGVDGSAAGRAALAAAGQVAEREHLEVVALHVRLPLSALEALGSAYAPDGGPLVRSCRDDGELSAWLDCTQLLEPLDLRWQFQVRDGDLVGQLRATADGVAARCVYLAARNRPWWARRLHHCPARAFARASGVPVHVSTYTPITEYCRD